MDQPNKTIPPLRRPFVIGGAVVGAVLSIWYLANNFGKYTPIPDPVWVKFVNICVFMFSSIFAANLLRRLVERLLKRK